LQVEEGYFNISEPVSFYSW